ncbi:MAG: hypothetical protein AWU58_968 [Methanohalophilus sp. T328-1]|jgi:uncharacterized LabA/DUF88 family protein|uniref:Uncharacterized LabA/DUF88 family protein n=1 Tax=Methanohalophilus euhalobius TaxID=51203 RepID=A0A285G9B7_9EURY|nr:MULTISPECIES: NYN domain-containing protein [Methanohalophilus]KXS45709.1 MAG: hypothetical protein AWU58_968 [Methanohalophilus sp. T328-1]RSD33803.1 MAG: hypothetical protein CI953_1312 [Methanohalophilus sp.]OBZ35939.1 MAG: Maebl [Methanohalophilus sp. DAL1]ODV50396.1 MAG: hypothetical protein A8273_400 [Methanohalophilus sp. 2-GBenrich]RSD35278.1 MAG: hypothetical protein CI952_1039 [Methanohalophilus sp.]
METDAAQKKLAVLIDADNAQPSIVEGLFSEIAKYGIASVKRIYGDWTRPNLKNWKDNLLEHSIQPIQQFSYTYGKNATDSSLIIDAMDLLYSEPLDGFCIVSSDSDFTRLSSRIRESGRKVYGFGEIKTPKPFIAACDKFIYTENLRKEEDVVGTVSESPMQAQGKWDTNRLKGDSKLVKMLRDAVEDSAEESGWAFLGNVGSNLVQKQPDFDPRNYGYKKMWDIFRAIDLFDIDEVRADNSSNNRLIYVKDKKSDGK